MTTPGILGVMHKYGREGVSALEAASPRDSGMVASSWGYRAYKKGTTYILEWTNSDIENGFPVAIMLQYGYGTGTGGYVQGKDFINPSLKPVFDRIQEEVWKAVTSA